MSATPRFKVFAAPTDFTRRVTMEYRASFHYLEDAASFVAFLGDGAEIRDGHTFVLWREGKEDIPALESFDEVRIVCEARIQAHFDRLREHSGHDERDLEAHMRASKQEIAEQGRCGRCLGMGYKGRDRGGKWRIETCPRCGGTGTAPNYQAAKGNVYSVVAR